MRKMLLIIGLALLFLLAACGDTGTTDSNPTEAPLGSALTETVDDTAPEVEASPTRED